MKQTQTICLNMIVKNESHIIVKTLENLCSYIPFSYWVISDTGSTDDTKEVITDFFKDRQINGELVEHDWVDFGYNRTKALESAYNKTDLLLIFDADDEIVGDFALPDVCDCDRYSFKFGVDFVYYRPLLINNRKKWCFKGVLHEFLVNIDEIKGGKNIEGNYHFVSGRSGDRSKNPNKYRDDAIILKKAHFDEVSKDYGLSCRYAFYCAQSYKDAGSEYIEDAIEWYKKCLDLKMWDQEKYHSCLTIGDLYMKKNDTENALKYWYKTIEYDSERIEGIINAVNYLRNNGQNLLVNALYHRFKNYKSDLQNKLFLFKSMYNNQLEYNNVISAFYVNDKISGYECCKKIIINKILPYNLLKLTLTNFKFYLNFIDQDTNEDVLQLFYAFNELVDMISLNNEPIDDTMVTIWNKLFEKCKPDLTKFYYYSFKNKENPKIFISFTTCKRLDLFKQTIYSMLNHWLDIKKIDFWFCVDDNSSDEDRLEMKSRFPWIDYYMKSPEEKGHRQSMNLIWNKLNELNPNYWIHMEDDFLFHNKMNYIDEAVNALSKLNELNVKQILFNRNYGETIQNYNTHGHVNINDNKKINNKIVLHNHSSDKFNYPNCHYWPHYSFRPSLIDVKTILDLGNYDTPNQFFEMDYAKRWTNAGYISAFFNRITCRHIGRLTSDRNTKVVKNAYDLNNEKQFNSCNSDNKVTTKVTTKVTSKAFIKIVNLERRKDRKDNIIDLLKKMNIDNEKYEFIKAVDGNSLTPTQELYNLFKGNDFGSRKGVIGCALSHYQLWKQLVNDKHNDFYLIMEDDIEFCDDFKTKLQKLIPYFDLHDVIFLGYHMFKKNRDKVKNIYDISREITNISKLDKSLYIGGTFLYSINKKGAKILIDYIENNSIKHGIDYVMKIVPLLNSYECQPHLVFSEWNENSKKIDSDIQNIYDGLDFTKINTNTNTNINTSHYHRGRLGNLFLVNMALHFIAKKNNLYSEYQEYDKIKQLGVELFSGTQTHEKENTIALSDDNFFDFIVGDCINKNISIVNNVWCQTSDFVLYLRIYFDEEEQKNNIIDHNKYKDRYNNNNDVYIHVRLGDIADKKWCQTFDYYDKVLNELVFENGYISSDSIDNIICKTLIIKYKLKVIDYNEVETIMFSSTCKHIVLSSGTFSWLIGFLAYYSNIYYPKIIYKWHGDIFVFKNWKQIEYDPDFILDVYNVLYKNIYVFIPNLDQHGNDIYYHKISLEDKFFISEKDPKCFGFNTLGFFKNKIDIDNLKPSIYFKERDGIYIKKEYYEEQLEKNKITNTNNNNNNNNIRIKMLCNWCSSEELCKEWANMCEEGFRWKNYQLVWTTIKEDIDYYVIINRPPNDAYFDPKKTIVFQMEPWVNDTNKPWGVKTWGKWAEPNPNDFLSVRGRKTEHHNNAFWQLELKLNDFQRDELFEKTKGCIISSICSSKYFDEGHIARIDFLKFLEEKGDVQLDIYNKDNNHSFTNYKGPLSPYVDKSNGLKGYKYYFMMENNFERNFITEKIWEPILCETLVFYYGCPNVADYIDPNAFVLLDITDFEKSYQIIKQAINEDWWSQRIDIIRQEKHRLLTDLSFFPVINKIINPNPNQNNNIKIVVARYNENIDWCKEFTNVLIYNKGSKLDLYNEILLNNVGREGHTYYKYIYDNYYNLDTYTIFLQGNPFDHSPNIINNIKKYLNTKHLHLDFEFLSETISHSNLSGCKTHYNLNLKDVYEKIFNIKRDNMEFQFGHGAQFIVSKTQILSRSREFYLNIVKILDYDKNPIEGYVIERFHKLIFANETFNKLKNRIINGSERQIGIKKLLNKCAIKYDDINITSIVCNTHDRGNENINNAEYSMCYNKDISGLDKYCGPDFGFYHWPSANIISFEQTKNQIIIEANKKPIIDKIGWYGNLYSPLKDVIEHKTRPLLKKIGDENPEIFDIIHIPPINGIINNAIPNYLSLQELVKYKYLIDIGGNGWSGRLKWLLFSKRPLLLVDRNYVEYFYNDLKPYVHFIPVKMDLSDLLEKVKWMKNNYEECLNIANNAFNFATINFTNDKLLEKIYNVYQNIIKAKNIE